MKRTVISLIAGASSSPRSLPAAVRWPRTRRRRTVSRRSFACRAMGRIGMLSEPVGAGSLLIVSQAPGLPHFGKVPTATTRVT